MRLSTFVPTALLLAAASANAGPVEHLRRAAGYTFDLFTGTRLQQDLSSQPSTSLEYTTENGRPHFQPMGAQRVGMDGPLLLQDTHLIDTLAHFVRERIPERVVHARGAGAHGYFEVTTDFAEQYSMADVFKKGTKVPATVRFSTVGGGRGSADEARDPRGFAIKLRSKKGILDWVFNNTPVFFIRDPAKFRTFIHTQKTHPQTNLRDKNMFWDYIANNEESMLQVLRLMSDLGTPYGFRHMSGWSGHTYRLVKENGDWVYTRVLLETDQGVKNFTGPEADAISGTNQEFGTQDLFESIEKGDYPSWTVKFQVMTAKEAENYRYSVLDLTKDWLDVPYHEVGKLVLTQNPLNYHAEVEQAHFSPSNMVEGWEASADPVLQSRLFSYNDAGRYRLGPNYIDIPVNCPFSQVANFDRDGVSATLGNQGSRPNYLSTEDRIKVPTKPAYIDNQHQVWTGQTVYYQSQMNETLDYEQPKQFWNQQLDQQGRENLIKNTAGSLSLATDQNVVEKTLQVLAKVSTELSEGVRKAIQESKQ
ncbi:catalase-like protein [Violaceomyces palustris]|uniref:Catalase-like protein n=1 Tax=Violaceomyces palustris TaxID=1673888 RepID=A0ACD0P1U0_9BASI|nr:catalase-like protein [Violaceomyces palustris]